MQFGALQDSSWNVWGFSRLIFMRRKKEECSHLHLENIGDQSLGDNEAAVLVSSCRITITEESQSRRVSREKETMNRLREQKVNFRPKDSTTDMGLAIGFLLLLCEKLNLWDTSTRDVVLLFVVVPTTSHLRCRFEDLPIFSFSGADVVGRADTIVSHCNQERFGDLLVVGLIDGGADFFGKVRIDVFLQCGSGPVSSIRCSTSKRSSNLPLPS